MRGNVSALYGAEAIGGVIQLFSRKANNKPAASVAVDIGSKGTRQLSLFGQLPISPSTQVSGQLTGFKTAGNSAIDTTLATSANPDKDGYSNGSVSLKLKHQFNPAHSLQVGFSRSKGSADFDDPYDLPTDTHSSEQTISQFNIQTEHQFSTIWNSRFLLSQSKDDYDSISSNPFSYSTNLNNSKQQQFQWQNTFQLLNTATAKHTLQAHVEYLKQTGRTSSLSGNFDEYRTDKSLVLAYVGQLGDQLQHQFQVNARNDSYSDFGNQSTGSLGYGYKITPKVQVLGQVATAFKAPSFNDLYFPFFGNPNLKAEKAKSYEIGLQYAEGATQARITYFNNDITDLITGSPSKNIGKSHINGIELSGNTQWLGLDWQGDLTLQDPINEINQKALTRRANRLASLSVHKNTGDLQYGLGLRHSTSRSDIDVVTAAAVELPAYTVLDAQLKYQLQKDLVLRVNLDNAFNKDVMFVHGYQTPGRVLRVGLKWSI